MKTLVAIAVLLSSLAFPLTSSATSNPPGCGALASKALTCTVTSYQPVFVNGFGSAFIPCLNDGKGENVVFSDTRTAVLYYKVTAGKRNGFYMHVGGPMHGKGQTTGINYTAQGSTQRTLANWVPVLPDGGIDGEGTFTETDNYYIKSLYPVVNVIWHRTTRFTNTLHPDGSFTSQDQPVEVVCK